MRYDLEQVKANVDRDKLVTRKNDLWRYRELLPLEDDVNRVSLGEGMTALLNCPKLAAEFGIAKLWVKDESQLPTGSFKARGMALAVSMAKELGLRRLAVPTAGNAGGAMAAYAARGGLEAYVFMPADTPVVNRYEATLFGAKAFVANGLIHECAAIVAQGMERMEWFDFSTLKEPYRIEGKKTMGLELAEQMNWSLPDRILYPTGGGTGLIGMSKAFAELETLGWLEGDRRPRLVSCQSSSCSPIAAAFDAGERFAETPTDPHTVASGIRVPKAVGDFMILDAVRASGGRAAHADESKLLDWMRIACKLEGISLCPEAAICLGVLERGLREGWIDENEEVVLFNTGAVQKNLECIEMALPALDLQNIDWDLISN